MADTPKVEAPEKAKKTESKFFRNAVHAGESIHLGFRTAGDPTTEELVSFTKYVFKVRGEDVFEGYLETADPMAIEKLTANSHAEEITETEYKKAIKDGRQVV